MKIAVTSQNWRTLTPHAGKTRRFIVYETKEAGGVTEFDRLELPQEMAVHFWNGIGPHPLDEMDVVIVASCGEGFARRMAARGIKVAQTDETDPLAAVESFLARASSAGEEAAVVAACGHHDAEHGHGHEPGHEHAHGHEHDHAHGQRHGCCCSGDTA